ncbi:hypothetical protein Tcan_13925 [Toxocara canis]|uniref:Uncharacterized protein n=1 Tax=Toxocara canis TaxID=6265 RepID=A0A0B2W1B3_TOXCA|nr:hypothetical protein Tcan_13925 [Toxocara canis]
MNLRKLQEHPDSPENTVGHYGFTVCVESNCLTRQLIADICAFDSRTYKTTWFGAITDNARCVYRWHAFRLADEQRSRLKQHWTLSTGAFHQSFDDRNQGRQASLSNSCGDLDDPVIQFSISRSYFCLHGIYMSPPAFSNVHFI